MTATATLVSAQDATTDYDCRVYGCPRAAKSNRGMYAYLCGEHIDEKRQTASQTPRAALEAARAPRAEPEAAAGLVAAVKALEAPARHLERSLGRRKAARTEAATALVDFQAALKAVRETAERLLSG